MVYDKFNILFTYLILQNYEDNLQLKNEMLANFLIQIPKTALKESIKESIGINLLK